MEYQDVISCCSSVFCLRLQIAESNFGEYDMLYVLAIFLPPIAVLVCGKPV